MALITIRDPATGEQQAIDASAFDPASGPYAGWEKLADGQLLADLQADKRAAIEARLGQAFQAGFTPAAGPIAGHLLQVRNNRDRTNWLSSHAAYSAQASAGNGAAMGAEFRDAANEIIICSYSDGLATLDAMAAWEKALRQNCWALKDQASAAPDEAALSAIDIESGWIASA